MSVLSFVNKIEEMEEVTECFTLGQRKATNNVEDNNNGRRLGAIINYKFSNQYELCRMTCN